MKLKTFVYSLTLATAFVACDTDSLELNSDIFDGQNFDFESQTFSVTTDQFSLNPIQSDNLSVAPFGILNNYFVNDPLQPNAKLQKVEAHYVTQLLLPSPKISFPLTVATDTEPAVPILPTVEKVVLYVPYFSTQTSVVDDVTKYNINDVFANIDPNVDANLPNLDKLSLKIYENKFLLRDFNPGSTSTQDYFSDAFTSINDVSAVNQLNNSTTNNNEQNQNFTFINTQIKYILPKVDPTDLDEEEKDQKLAPGLFAELDVQRFQDILVEYEKEQKNAASSKIFNQNIFNTWFRGIFLKVEENTPNAKQLALLNFANAYVKVYYRETTANDVKSIKNFDLKFGGRNVSLYNNDNNHSYNLGSDKFILQGNQGKIATIALNFNNGIPDGPDSILDLSGLRSNAKTNKWLINEAELTFYSPLDFSDLTDPTNLYPLNFIPYRIYLYDYENNSVLADFFDDSSQNTAARDRYISYGGFYDKNTKTYKIRVTEHIKRLLAFDTDAKANEANVELGLVIVQNISDFGFRNIKENTDNKIPRSIAYQPLSTVLYSENGPADKKLQLKITYTKPKNN